MVLPTMRANQRGMEAFSGAYLAVDKRNRNPLMMSFWYKAAIPAERSESFNLKGAFTTGIPDAGA